MKSFEKLEVLRAAVCVVGADGEVGETENRLIDRLADEIGVGQASREAMLERGKTDPNFCEEMFRVLKISPKDTIITLFQVAMVDGKLGDEEIRVLGRFAEKLGIKKESFNSLVEQAQSKLDR